MRGYDKLIYEGYGFYLVVKKDGTNNVICAFEGGTLMFKEGAIQVKCHPQVYATLYTAYYGETDGEYMSFDCSIVENNTSTEPSAHSEPFKVEKPVDYPLSFSTGYILGDRSKGFHLYNRYGERMTTDAMEEIKIVSSDMSIIKYGGKYNVIYFNNVNSAIRLCSPIWFDAIEHFNTCPYYGGGFRFVVIWKRFEYSLLVDYNLSKITTVGKRKWDLRSKIRVKLASIFGKRFQLKNVGDPPPLQCVEDLNVVIRRLVTSISY